MELRIVKEKDQEIKLLSAVAEVEAVERQVGRLQAAVASLKTEAEVSVFVGRVGKVGGLAETIAKSLKELSEGPGRAKAEATKPAEDEEKADADSE